MKLKMYIKHKFNMICKNLIVKKKKRRKIISILNNNAMTKVINVLTAYFVVSIF